MDEANITRDDIQKVFLYKLESQRVEPRIITTNQNDYQIFHGIRFDPYFANPMIIQASADPNSQPYTVGTSILPKHLRIIRDAQGEWMRAFDEINPNIGQEVRFGLEKVMIDDLRWLSPEDYVAGVNEYLAALRERNSTLWDAYRKVEKQIGIYTPLDVSQVMHGKLPGEVKRAQEVAFGNGLQMGMAYERALKEVELKPLKTIDEIVWEKAEEIAPF